MSIAKKKKVNTQKTVRFSVLKKKKRLELPEVYSFIYCIHILYEPTMGMQEMLQKQRAKQCPQGAHRLAAGDTAGPGAELGAGCSQGQREREKESLSLRDKF